MGLKMSHFVRHLYLNAVVPLDGGRISVIRIMSTSEKPSKAQLCTLNNVLLMSNPSVLFFAFVPSQAGMRQARNHPFGIHALALPFRFHSHTLRRSSASFHEQRVKPSRKMLLSKKPPMHKRGSARVVCCGNTGRRQPARFSCSVASPLLPPCIPPKSATPLIRTPHMQLLCTSGAGGNPPWQEPHGRSMVQARVRRVVLLGPGHTA